MYWIKERFLHPNYAIVDSDLSHLNEQSSILVSADCQILRVASIDIMYICFVIGLFVLLGI